MKITNFCTIFYNFDCLFVQQNNIFKIMIFIYGMIKTILFNFLLLEKRTKCSQNTKERERERERERKRESVCLRM